MAGLPSCPHRELGRRYLEHGEACSRGRCLFPRKNHRPRARQCVRCRIGRRFVEAQESAEVDDFLLRELRFERVGHERELAGLDLVDLAALDCLDLAALKLENDSLVAVFDQQAGQDAAFRRCERGGLVAGADHQAGVEHVRDELVEVIAAVGRDLGPDVLALAVNLVALRTDLLEDGLARDRVARRLCDQAANSVGDSLAFRVAPVANGTP